MRIYINFWYKHFLFYVLDWYFTCPEAKEGDFNLEVVWVSGTGSVVFSSWNFVKPRYAADSCVSAGRMNKYIKV